MKVFHSEAHRTHNPPFEVFDGGQRVPYLESPERVDRILAALRKAEWAEILHPQDFGLGPIRAVHEATYIDFLANAWNDWLALSPEVEAASDRTAILPATFALRRQPRLPKSFLGRAGYFMMDLSAVIVAGTYKAALASVNCAMSAAASIVDGQRSAFALCRPPGHHAGKNYAAGYCFLNNTAVAANWLSSNGKVAVLDVDYHAGNGTQDIFYDRSDVLTISIHADPDFEYPHFIGFADEIGYGIGQGFHHNFPLPAGTDDKSYLETLNRSLDLIQAFEPRYLVVSLGADIYESDPLGQFEITHEGIREIAQRIADMKIPSAIVMEGGYNNDALGGNVTAFLAPFHK